MSIVAAYNLYVPVVVFPDLVGPEYSVYSIDVYFFSYSVEHLVDCVVPVGCLSPFEELVVYLLCHHRNVDRLDFLAVYSPASAYSFVFAPIEVAVVAIAIVYVGAVILECYFSEHFLLSL